MVMTAILVDGGFYRKRAKHQWGIKTAEERAKELNAYCHAHINKKDGPATRQLYRIFYYDCEPSKRSVYHPLTKQNIELDKSDPMGADIKDDLFEHIDGLETPWKHSRICNTEQESGEKAKD